MSSATTTTATTTPKTMKAAILHKNGDPTDSSVLSVQDNTPVPDPKEGEILIKIHAAAINPIDWKMMQGDFPGLASGVVGFDVSGTVEQVGPNTPTDLKVGDDVYADAIGTKGSFAEYMVVKSIALAKKPTNASMVEAAALPLAGLTALQGLTTIGQFQAGQKVLIFGGSGGVGSLAIQMAKAMGASEVYSTGSDVNLIKGFGADVVVNYKEESLMEALKGKDFDLVYDTIGGYEHWEVAQAAMKKAGGTYVTIVGDGDSFMITMAKVVWRKLSSTIFGGPNYSIFLTDTKTENIVVPTMKKMTELVESGSVKAVLEKQQYELTTDGIHAMVKASMSHRAKGKLVLKVR